MDRSRLLKSATAIGVTVGLYRATANAYMPEHNWDKYNWGSGLSIPDRLYQGPFPQPTGVDQAMLILPQTCNGKG
jgi:hypothetical protein